MSFPAPRGTHMKTIIAGVPDSDGTRVVCILPFQARGGRTRAA